MADYLIGNKKPLGLAVDAVRAIVEGTTIRTQPIEQPYNNRNAIEAGTFVITDDVSTKTIKYGVSELGTPIYSQVTFGLKAGQNTVVNNGAAGTQIITPNTYTAMNGDIVHIPVLTFQAILISVSFPRNIVKTSIQGRNGTVKEYIGEGDAQISFRGVITGKNGQRPTQQIKDLMDLIKSPVSIPVINDFLNNELAIYNIVFDDRSFEQEEGGYSYQGFSLNAMSDETVNLTINV